MIGKVGALLVATVLHSLSVRQASRMADWQVKACEFSSTVQGGEVIRALRSETGARIKVLESVEGSQERAVVISSSVTADGEWAPAQLALFRVHSCIMDAEGDSSSARVEASPCF